VGDGSVLCPVALCHQLAGARSHAGHSSRSARIPPATPPVVLVASSPGHSIHFDDLIRSHRSCHSHARGVVDPGGKCQTPDRSAQEITSTNQRNYTSKVSTPWGQATRRWGGRSRRAVDSGGSVAIFLFLSGKRCGDLLRSAFRQKLAAVLLSS
jgi:hypothetical protein